MHGRGYGAESRGQTLHGSSCFRSNLTVWKEDKFTVLSGQGIKECEWRVSECIISNFERVAQTLKTKSGPWGCVYLDSGTLVH